MLVVVLTIIFAAIMLGVGAFLFTHQNKPFLVFHPESIPGLRLVVKVFGGLFMACGLVFLVILFLDNDQLLFWMLIIACFIVIAFQITIARYFGKK
ncbi:hypothetical protein MOO44_08110 [Nicoliella spurrieriana]|uniref:DUF3784 domain-containing protein n=1 Tax=Nicoliella spurrieriana TaxID=2925830 RepID=A0A976X5M1_9LACO|nr:hypothetical protein [Nicoliella spurrieriana]UQS86819.1 hypothetical protein MOO44_08110 [Nicoliella spurrieriana]